MHPSVTKVVFIALAAALATQRSASSQAGGTETVNFNKVKTLVGEIALEEKIAQITPVNRRYARRRAISGTMHFVPA